MYKIFEMLLAERGVTAYQVSKATGISTGSLTDWKKGRSQPKIDKLQKIANYFGVSVNYLLTGEQEKPDTQKDAEPDDNVIKFALFGGAATDAQLDEVKRFAQFIKERDKK